MQTVYHETPQILDIMPYDRYDLARLIVARFQGQDDTPTIRHLLAQQWYAEDLKTRNTALPRAWRPPIRATWFGCFNRWTIRCQGWCRRHALCVTAIAKRTRTR